MCTGFCLFTNCDNIVLADEYSDTQADFQDTVYSQIEQIDFSFLDQVIFDLNEEAKEIFSTSSFTDKIYEIVNSDYEFNFNSLANIVIKLIVDNVFNILPILISLIALALLLSFIVNFKSKSGGGTSDIVHFLVYGVAIIIVSTLVSSCIVFVNDCLISIKEQMQGIFPIMLTLITALGGYSSSSMLQPLLFIFSNVLFDLFLYYLLPLFFICFVFTIANHLNKNEHFSKLIDFVQSLFKWSIGLIFTLFTAFLALSGIIAGTRDGISIKITKYTIKGTVPYIGSYMSDGLDIILSSSVLIKNTVGVCGLILLISCIIVPLIKLIIVNLCLKLTGAIIEPFSDKRISGFIFSVSKCFNMLIAIIISCSLMYFLCLGALMIVCNYF